MFLQLGMGPTLVRFFAKTISKGEKDELRKINSTAQFLLGSLGFFASVLFLCLIPVFINFYNIPEAFVKETIGLLICIAISLFLNMTLIVPQGLVFGFNRYDLSSFIEIGGHLLHLLFIVALFELFRPSIFFVGLAILLSSFFRFVMLFAVAIKNMGKAILFSFHSVNRNMIRSIFGFSMLNIANSIAAAVVSQGPVFIIGKVMGESMVTAFSPALLISVGMCGFLGKTTRPLVPIASLDHVQNKGAGLAKLAISSGQLAAFLGFGMALPLSTFGHEIMMFWLGKELAWIWPIVAVMTTGVAISQVQAANYYLALGGGHIKPTVYSQIIMAVVVFSGTIVGTVWFEWTLLAVSLHIGACILVCNTFYLAYEYSRQFSYTYLNYLWAVYGLPALFASICCAGGWILKCTSHSLNIFLLIIQSVIVLTAYTILCWCFMLPWQLKTKLIKQGLTTIRRIVMVAVGHC
jgi:O-antigen/teichoic acid export membrane protein